MIFDGIENACIQLQEIKNGEKSISSLGTLDELINELKHS